jgi:NADPH:quinone reductase-like Zn-dependent oxidoreductase
MPMEITMKAWMLDPTDLQVRLEEVDRPTPGPTDLLVRVHAAAMNRGELLQGAKRVTRPKIAGIESAGVVEAVGNAVSRFKPGDRVTGRAAGGFAQYTLIDERDAIAVPAGLGWADAAAVPIAGLVAYDMLVAEGELRAGQHLLVTGITSGVGVACLQIAKAIGARVIGTSGSAAKLERLQTLGLDQAVITRGSDFVDQALAFSGGSGVNLAVDTVGGSQFAACIASLGYQGRLAIVGHVDGVMRAEIDLGALHRKRLRVFGVSNAMRTAEQRVATVAGFSRDVMPWIAQGRFKPLIDRILPFDQVPQAHEAMRADTHVGKIVVEVPAG